MIRIIQHSFIVAVLITVISCGTDSPGISSSALNSSSSLSTSVSSSNTSHSNNSSANSSTENKLVIAINSGGQATHWNGIDYLADQFVQEGSTHNTQDAIQNQMNGRLFQSERYGDYDYEIPVTAGVFDIHLHFAEIFHEAINERIIQVDIENLPALNNLDIFKEVNHDSGYTVELTGIEVSDGFLSIAIRGVTGDGTLSGFAVFSKNGSFQQPPKPPIYSKELENSAADCGIELSQLTTADQLPSNAKLPNPFISIAGDEISQIDQWHCRRQEIHRQAEKYIYGEKPPKPDSVSGTVTNSKVTVNIEHQGKTVSFSADIVLPSTGQAPYPAMINIGAKGGFGGITLGESRILNEGVAVIYYNHYDLGREGTPEQSRGLPNQGKFYDLYGGNHSAGLLMSWAWGASRLIDVLQDSGKNLIDTTGLAVTGCSRNGKGAFATGVFDERIALTIPHETSTAGVPAYRIVDELNTERTDHNYYGLNWLSNDFEPFVLNANQLPIDSHSIIGMVAPRGLLILENPHERQMSAPAGYIAAVAGAAVFKALGVENNISYHSNVPNTGHCSYKSEYTPLLLKNITKFLKHESALTGDFIVGSNGSLNLTDWVDWQTPVLRERSTSK